MSPGKGAPPLAERLRGRRVGVVLSAGYFGFFGHAGFVQALEDAGIAVACWAGASAGALVAAMAAAGLTGERIVDRLAAARREAFWDPDPLGVIAAGLGRHRRRGQAAAAAAAAATGLLRGEKLRALLSRELPARFEDLPAPLLVVASNLSRNRSQAFTRGELASRVHASCAYPGLFRAAEVDGELFWDGGLLDKAPVEALHRAFAPEALVVHWLPSRAAPGRGSAALSGPLAWPRAMAAAMAALRADHFRLQVERLREKGVPVAVVKSELARLGPGLLGKGREIAAQARRKVAETLDTSLDASA